MAYAWCDACCSYAPCVCALRQTLNTPRIHLVPRAPVTARTLLTTINGHCLSNLFKLGFPLYDFLLLPNLPNNVWLIGSIGIEIELSVWASAAVYPTIWISNANLIVGSWVFPSCECIRLRLTLISVTAQEGAAAAAAAVAGILIWCLSWHSSCGGSRRGFLHLQRSRQKQAGQGQTRRGVAVAWPAY